MDADFETIREMVNGVDLPGAARHTAGWCMGQLPGLYAEFRDSCDTRSGDEIRRLLGAVLTLLVEQGRDPAAARAVADHLRAMHERFGLPVTVPEPPAARPPRRRRAG